MDTGQTYIERTETETHRETETDRQTEENRDREGLQHASPSLALLVKVFFSAHAVFIVRARVRCDCLADPPPTPSSLPPPPPMTKGSGFWWRCMRTLQMGFL